MRVIAMYLPQFHRIKENDEWWGEGFTDWTAAGNARPLYDGHYQPHIPLNDNYYDLLEKDTLQWQAGLMKKYGIDGMCFYHYWFKGGKRILEKPAENLLQWKDVDMPFCFCWANESWAKTWKAIPGANVWTIDDNSNEDKGIKPVFLLEQDYGSVRQWEEHFMYLLPFFRDERYVKIDGRPVFQFYHTGQIYCLGDMLYTWQELAKSNGLPGLYIMAANLDGKQIAGIDAEFLFEPSKCLGNVKETVRSGVTTCLYDEVWQYILQPKGTLKKQYLCGLVSFDTTPRKKEFGVSVEGASPEKFGSYMKALMKNSEEKGSEMVFVTAWNEWGEGNHLEPDEKYGYQWLEQLRDAKQSYREYGITLPTEKYIHNLIRNSSKYEIYLNFMDRWMMLREHEITIESVLCRKNISSVLIYGYGIIGKHLLSELAGSKVCVMGIVDQKHVLAAGVGTYTPEEILPQADAIIVASFYFFDEIKNVLKSYFVSTDIISIEEIVNEAFVTI